MSGLPASALAARVLRGRPFMLGDCAGRKAQPDAVGLCRSMEHHVAQPAGKRAATRARIPRVLTAARLQAFPRVDDAIELSALGGAVRRHVLLATRRLYSELRGNRSFHCPRCRDEVPGQR